MQWTNHLVLWSIWIWDFIKGWAKCERWDLDDKTWFLDKMFWFSVLATSFFFSNTKVLGHCYYVMVCFAIYHEIKHSDLVIIQGIKVSSYYTSDVFLKHDRDVY